MSSEDFERFKIEFERAKVLARFAREHMLSDEEHTELLRKEGLIMSQEDEIKICEKLRDLRLRHEAD